jgi:hypothetical protein
MRIKFNNIADAFGTLQYFYNQRIILSNGETRFRTTYKLCPYQLDGLVIDIPDIDNAEALLRIADDSRVDYTIL